MIGTDTDGAADATGMGDLGWKMSLRSVTIEGEHTFMPMHLVYSAAGTLACMAVVLFALRDRRTASLREERDNEMRSDMQRRDMAGTE